MPSKRTKEDNRRHYLNRAAKFNWVLKPDYDATPKALARGKELREMEQLPVLPWPRELYRDHSGLQMSQTLTQQKPRKDSLCVCGKEHRQNIPRTIRSTYGFGFSVTYYCSNACKSRAAQQDSR